MNQFTYQAINYSRVPSQDATLFIMRTLAEAAQNTEQEFINLSELLHQYMFFGQNDLKLNYKSGLKKFNGAAMWLFMHGSLVLVGEEAVSLNHSSKAIKPSRSDVRVFKYALSLASYEFDESVNTDKQTRFAHI